MRYLLYDMTVEKILLGYDPKTINLLPALKKISAVFGYVSKMDAQKIAGYFSIPLSKVYETASFYDLINTKKQPGLIIKVCSSTHCVMSNSFEIIREIENYFRIKAGDELNPKVKLEAVSCLGQCGEGPIMIINDKVYQNVTASSVHGILENWT
jgi:NADH-quinone oxidoreductase subunit E